VYKKGFQKCICYFF